MKCVSKCMHMCICSNNVKVERRRPGRASSSRELGQAALAAISRTQQVSSPLVLPLSLGHKRSLANGARMCCLPSVFASGVFAASLFAEASNRQQGLVGSSKKCYQILAVPPLRLRHTGCLVNSSANSVPSYPAQCNTRAMVQGRGLDQVYLCCFIYE